MYGIHYGAGYYLKPWLMLGFTGSYNFFEYNQRDTNGNVVSSGDRSGFGDFELKTKIRVIKEDRYALPIMPLVTVPTNAGKFDPDTGTVFENDSFLSDEEVGYGAKVLYEYLFSFHE